MILDLINLRAFCVINLILAIILGAIFIVSFIVPSPF